MGQKRSKNHHFVPKAIQRQFRAEGDRIWYSERDRTGGYSEPELRNIDKTFIIRNYYTILGDDDLPSDLVERKFYGAIDDYLGKAVPQICSWVSEGRVVTFSDPAQESIRNVLFEMVKRTPEFTASYDDLEVGRGIVSGIVKDAELQPSLSNEVTIFMERYNKDAEIRALGRDVRVRAVLKNSPRVREALQERVVKLVVCAGRHSFILASMIAYRIGNGGANGLQNPDSEIWMPISPKVAIVLVRDPSASIPPVSKIDRDKVREINEFAVRNSKKAASHSERLLRSILCLKA